MPLQALKSLALFGPLLIPMCCDGTTPARSTHSSLVEQLFFASCASDSEIPSAQRAITDRVALGFVRAVLSDDPEKAYSQFTSDAMKDVDAGAFAQMMRSGIQPQGPFSNLRVVHSYKPKLTGGTGEQRVVCGNLSEPQGWVAMTAKPAVEQAHVAVEGETLNNTWAFIVWLIQERGEWRIRYLQVATIAIVGKSAEDVWTLARAEKQLQHDFNAIVLYASALQLAWRGPHFQLGIHPEIRGEMASLRVPEHLQGQPPFSWSFGEGSFEVSNVGPVGIGGKLYLSITHQLGAWPDDETANRKNRELMTAFKQRYPEYAGVFAGLIVEAREKEGTRGYRTVDDRP